MIEEARRKMLPSLVGMGAERLDEYGKVISMRSIPFSGYANGDKSCR